MIEVWWKHGGKILKQKFEKGDAVASDGSVIVIHAKDADARQGSADVTLFSKTLAIFNLDVVVKVLFNNGKGNED